MLYRFFVNIFVGLYSFIIRLVLNILLGMLWISRLDKNMMTRGYEYIDPGYRTYVGFLMLDYHYCNPVMVTFATMLSASNTQRRHNRKLFLKEVGVVLHKRVLSFTYGCCPSQTGVVLHIWVLSFTNGVVLHKRVLSFTNGCCPSHMGVILHVQVLSCYPSHTQLYNSV
jgi:hypothetical protein